MAAEQTGRRVLVGPRSLDDRICRVVYLSETDEAWTEEWRDCAWVRAAALVRHVLKAPAVTRTALSRFGIPNEPGELDLDLVYA